MTGVQTCALPILKNIAASLPADMFLPYNVGRDLLGIYRSLSVATLPHSMGLLVICRVPILSSKSQFDLMKVVNLPVHFENSSMVGEFKLEHKTFAVSKDLQYVIFPDRRDYYACSRPQTKFCTIHAPQFRTSEYDKDCLLGLFLARQSSQARCPINMRKSTKTSSVRYLYQGVWAVSVAHETVMKVLCDNGQETNLVLKPSVHVFKLEKGCQGVSKEFQLNKFLVGDTNYELAKVPSQTQNFTVWDQLVKLVH